MVGMRGRKSRGPPAAGNKARGLSPVSAGDLHTTDTGHTRRLAGAWTPQTVCGEELSSLVLPPGCWYGCITGASEVSDQQGVEVFISGVPTVHTDRTASIVFVSTDSIVIHFLGLSVGLGFSDAPSSSFAQMLTLSFCHRDLFRVVDISVNNFI